MIEGSDRAVRPLGEPCIVALTTRLQRQPEGCSVGQPELVFLPGSVRAKAISESVREDAEILAEAVSAVLRRELAEAAFA